jgi:hypothetical protein
LKRGGVRSASKILKKKGKRTIDEDLNEGDL